MHLVLDKGLLLWHRMKAGLLRKGGTHSAQSSSALRLSLAAGPSQARNHVARLYVRAILHFNCHVRGAGNTPALTKLRKFLRPPAGQNGPYTPNPLNNSILLGALASIASPIFITKAVLNGGGRCATSRVRLPEDCFPASTPVFACTAMVSPSEVAV